MLRSFLLFIHVVSSMGMFAEEPARLEAALSGYRWLRLVGAVSLAGTILSGAYLASTASVWSAAWVDVALGGVVLVAAMGATMTRLRVARLEQSVRKRTGGLPGIPVRDPVLWLSFRTRTAVLVGIVFLMATKPGWQGSLLAMAIALAAGLLLSLPGFRGRAPAP